MIINNIDYLEIIPITSNIKGGVSFSISTVNIVDTGFARVKSTASSSPRTATMQVNLWNSGRVKATGLAQAQDKLILLKVP